MEDKKNQKSLPSCSKQPEIAAPGWRKIEIRDNQQEEPVAGPSGLCAGSAGSDTTDEVVREIAITLVKQPTTANATQPSKSKAQQVKIDTSDNTSSNEIPVVTSAPTSIITAAPVSLATAVPTQVFATSGHQMNTIGTPVISTPIMVTGVVIPKSPVASNFISFVDASGNVQLAAVAAPVQINQVQIQSQGTLINPVSIQNSVISAGSSSPNTYVMTSPQSSLGPQVARIPLSSAIKPIQSIICGPNEPPVLKGTVRAIQPNNINVVSVFKQSECTVVDFGEGSSKMGEGSGEEIQYLETIEAVNETGESSRAEDEDRVNDVKDKILSVSSSQGTSKADDLAKTNLFKLVKNESNVVITAPSTAVRDILEQLKRQFPDKKFVINYNTSKVTPPIPNPTVVEPREPPKRKPEEVPPTPTKRPRKAAMKKEIAAANKKSSYKSARLRGEKAPEVFVNGKAEVVSPAKTELPVSKRNPTGRGRGRPRKERTTEPVVEEVEVKEEPEPEEDDLESEPDSPPENSSSEYNSEIRVGEEFQAVLSDFLGGRPKDDYDEKATLVFHPDKGLLEEPQQSSDEGAEISDFPMHDFAEWTEAESKVFKRFLGNYKTNFPKYLAILPTKRLRDIIDHYYKSHNPSKDSVLNKNGENKHYFLVSKNKQIVAPKGVFGVLNEKRRVVPNRKFCSNSSIVLYEDALPTRKQTDMELRKQKSSGAKGAGKTTAKAEKASKAASQGATTESKANKKTVEASNGASDGNTSLYDDAMRFVSSSKKKRAPRNTKQFNEMKELLKGDVATEIANIDSTLETLSDEINSLKTICFRNKVETAQKDIELKKLAKSVRTVTKAIDKARKITDVWTEEDRLLTIQAIKTYGKNFDSVSRLVGTKTGAAIKAFYDTNNTRYGLDIPLAMGKIEEAVSSSQNSISSPTKSTSESPMRGPRPVPSILRRKVPMKTFK